MEDAAGVVRARLEARVWIPRVKKGSQFWRKRGTESKSWEQRAGIYVEPSGGFSQDVKILALGDKLTTHMRTLYTRFLTYMWERLASGKMHAWYYCIRDAVMKNEHRIITMKNMVTARRKEGL